MEKSQIALTVSLLLAFFLSANAVYNINVVNFGAKPDGNSDSTKALLRSWTAACSSRQTVVVYVPKGRYLIKRLTFRGPCRNNATSFQMDGTLVAPSYKVLRTANWIVFNKVHGVLVNGGRLDGKGGRYWACKTVRKSCPPGATSLAFKFSSDIRVTNLKSVNSQNAHIMISNCNNVVVEGVKLVAPNNSPNTDGIHVQLSTGVTITGTSIKTGDDCVSVGPGTRNLWIEGTSCGPGHGISIGSLGKELVEKGVENVTVKSVVFTGSENGLRIKSWARRSNGFVRGVLYEDIIMRNVKNPIVIDQHYCPSSAKCPHQESGIKISRVTYRNIRGTSASKVAMKFDCSPTNPCNDIKLEGIELNYRHNEAKSDCVHAGGVSSGSVLPESCLLAIK